MSIETLKDNSRRLLSAVIVLAMVLSLALNNGTAIHAEDSVDLKDFITDVKIGDSTAGVTLDEGAEAATEVTFEITKAIDPTKTLTFSYPDGMSVTDTAEQFTLKVTDSEGEFDANALYTLSDNKLSVVVAENDRLAGMTSATFSIKANAVFKDTGAYKFGQVARNVTVNTAEEETSEEAGADDADADADESDADVKEDKKDDASDKEDKTEVVTEDKESEAETEETVEEDTDAEEEAEEEETSAKTEYVYEDDDLKVTATLTEAGAVSDKAELVVTPVVSNLKSTKYNYQAYMKALNSLDNSSLTPTYTEENTLLYDIALILDGKEVEPTSGTITINTEFKGDQLASIGADSAEDVEVIHMPLVGEVRESVDTTADATDITADDIELDVIDEADIDTDKNGNLEFETDSLCTFVYWNRDNTTENGKYNDAYMWSGTKNTSWTVDGFIESLGMAADTLVYADVLEDNYDHLEGNIVVNTMIDTANQALNKDASGTRKNNAVTSMTIVKNVSKAVAKDTTFTMGFYKDAEGTSKIIDKTIDVTVKKGEKTASVTINAKTDSSNNITSTDPTGYDDLFTYMESGTAYVFEVDSKTGAAQEGGTVTADNTVYTVTYKDGESSTNVIENLANSVANYIGSLQKTKTTTYYTYQDDSGNTVKINEWNIDWTYAQDGSRSGTYDGKTVTEVTETTVVKNLDNGNYFSDINVNAKTYLETLTASLAGTADADVGQKEYGYNTQSYGYIFLYDASGKLVYYFNTGQTLKDTANNINTSASGAIELSDLFETLSASDFESATGLDANLGSNGHFAALSSELASMAYGTMADTGQDINVINVISSTGKLKEDLFNLGFTGDSSDGTLTNKTNATKITGIRDLIGDTDLSSEYLVINIDATGYDTYNLESLKGLNGELDGDSNGTFSWAGSHIIYNVVQNSSGKYVPYTGTVNISSASLAGLVFAPAATITKNAKIAGAMIGKKVVINSEEAHGKVFSSSKSRSVTVTVGNSTGASGSATLKGEKTLTGRKLEKDNFTFVISGGGLATDVEVTNVAAATGKTTAAISYPTIEYVVDAEKTETTTTYDSTTNTITIAVPSTNDLADATKTFTVTEKNVSDGVISTDKGVSLVSPTNNSYTVTAKAALDSSDKSKIIVTLSDNATALNFTNKYKASGTTEISGTKTLNGRKLKADEFSFEISGGDLKSAVKVKNAADGTINYPKFKYMVDPDGTAGTTYDEKTNTITITVTHKDNIADKTFTIKEADITDNDGVTNVSTNKSYEVTISAAVKAAPDTDQLTVTATEKDKKALNFTNEYNAEGTATIKGTKTLKGRTLAKDEFSFEISGGDLTSAITVKNNADGSINYPSFKYVVDPDGTAGTVVKDNVITVTVKSVEDLASANKTYTIKEATVTEKGVTNVSETKTYTLTTSAAAVEGKESTLKVTLSDNAQTLNFTNEYNAEGSATITGTKTLNGRTLKADEFSFEISGGGLKEAVTVKNKADGTINYPTFKYEVDADGTAGTTYDEKTNTITIKVTDVKDLAKKTFTVKEADITDNDGVKNVSTATSYTVNVTAEVNKTDASKLDVKADKNSGLNFTNEYNAEGETTISGMKTLDGRTLKADEFEFEISGGDLKSAVKVKNAADGTINYPKFKYMVDADGTAGTTYDSSKNVITITVTKVEDLKEKEFTVKEVVGNLTGVTYATNSYTVKVSAEVNDDDASKLDVKADKNSGLNFTNTYETSCDITLEGTKVLENKTLTDGAFSFTVKEDGKTVATGKNDKSGKITFSKIQYKLADVGTHTYTVTEDIPDDADEIGGAFYKDGIIYDSASYTVTVTVSYDKSTGIMTAKADKSASDVTFTNNYSANGGLTFSGTKVFEGRDVKDDDLFLFKVEEVNKDGSAYEAKSGEETINYASVSGPDFKSGKATWETGELLLWHYQVGTHYYKITETAGDLSGVTYDSTSYIVKVEVTDNGDGTLKITKDDTAKSLTFTNTWETEVKIKKTDVGGKDLAGAKIEIRDENGKVVDSYTTDGKTHTTKLEAGTYTMVETTAPQGYEVAETITFKVGSDGKVTVDGKEVDTVTMVDEYSEYSVKIKKTDVGGKDLAGAKLRVVDADGNLVDSWTTNGKEHSVALTAGTYTLIETQAPALYKKAESITFKVAMDGTVTVNGQKVTKITMVDKGGDVAGEDDENDEDEDQGTEGEDSNGETAGEDEEIDTGDTTNITMWAVIMAVAMMVLAALKRKAHQN